MVFITLLYLAILGLLVFGAIMFFGRALRPPGATGQPPSSLDFVNRKQIVEQLERQFDSSPSSEL